MKAYLSLALMVAMAGPAFAQVVDGTVDGSYGAPLSVQTVETQFGDATSPAFAGSELDAGYMTSDGVNLYLMLTGNVEANFNKLNIFIDSKAGGQNTIGAGTNQGGVNPNNDDWAQNYSGIGPASGGPSSRPGFTFDNGFTADYLVIFRRGGSQADLDFSSVGSASTVEVSGAIFGGSNFGTNASVGASGLGVAYNGSNSLGVVGGTGPANAAAAAAVTTGLELRIPLSAIGATIGSTIRVSAHINGSNHDYLSNQSLGGFAGGTGNLGGDGLGGFNNDVAGLNLNQFAGDQFFSYTVVPEPASAVLVGLALVGLGARRRA